MPPLLLSCSLLLLLASTLLECPLLFAVSLVSTIVSLAAIGGAPRIPLVLFWVWVNSVLLYLLAAPTADESNLALVLGIPAPAFWMLVGVGIVPVLLWPLIFFFGFRKWMSR